MWRNGSIVVLEESLEPGTFVRNAGGILPLAMRSLGQGHPSPPTWACCRALGSTGFSLIHVPSLASSPRAASSPRPLGHLHLARSCANRPELLAQLGADGFGAVDLGMVADGEAALPLYPKARHPAATPSCRAGESASVTAT